MSDLIKAVKLFTDAVVDMSKNRNQLLLIPQSCSFKKVMITFKYAFREEDETPFFDACGDLVYSHWMLSTQFDEYNAVIKFNYPSGSTLFIRKIENKDCWYGGQYSDIIMPNQCTIETKMLAMARLRSAVVSDLNLYFY